MKGQALFVEAVTPPIKRIRHAALELVDAVSCSGVIDSSIHSSLGTGAHWDLLAPILPQQCPHEAIRSLLARVRAHFVHRYAGWQALALRNGRFFPPPMRWELTMDTQGCVQVLLGWSPGFLPDDQVLVMKRGAADLRQCSGEFVKTNQTGD
jgi:hypothetical protein